MKWYQPRNLGGRVYARRRKPDGTPMASPNPHFFKAKICLLGESSVGKTSLVGRFVRSCFREDYARTLGALVTKTTVNLLLDQTVYRVDLMVWDIMGNQDFLGTLADAYLNHAEGALAVFDVTRGPTLEALKDWVGATRRFAGQIPIVILGNKADLPRAIPDEAVADVARSLKVDFRLTSAKTGQNVKEAFEGLARTILQTKVLPVPLPQEA